MRRKPRHGRPQGRWLHVQCSSDRPRCGHGDGGPDPAVIHPPVARAALQFRYCSADQVVSVGHFSTATCDVGFFWSVLKKKVPSVVVPREYLRVVLVFENVIIQHENPHRPRGLPCPSSVGCLQVVTVTGFLEESSCFPELGSPVESAALASEPAL